jgi:hypothetical protein
MLTLITCQDYVYKCDPKNDSIVPELMYDANYKDFNITEEFLNLSSTLPTYEKRFFSLVINNTYIEEIPENVFQDTSSLSVEIHESRNLSKIHSNTFNNNTINNFGILSIYGPTNLRNNPRIYDLYKALN